MDTFSLSRAVGFLKLEDVHSVVQVCRAWQELMDAETSKRLWQQVCKNSYPDVAAVLDYGDGWDWRGVFQFLRQAEMPIPVEDVSSPLKVPTTLQLNDVTAILEFYTLSPRGRRKSLGFLTQSLGTNNDGCLVRCCSPKGFVLKGRNPYYGCTEINIVSPDLFKNAYHDSIGLDPRRSSVQKLHYRVVLLRRDTYQLLCLMDEGTLELGDPSFRSGEPMGQGDYGGLWNEYDPFAQEGYFTVDLSNLDEAKASISRTPSNNRETSLHGIRYENADDGAYVGRIYTVISLEITLSDCLESTDTPTWLKALRNRTLRTNHPDLTAIQFFQFEISSVGLYVGGQNHVEYSQNGQIQIDNPDDMRVVLGALPWSDFAVRT